MSMFDDPYSSLVWYLLAGTRGGQTRCLILETIKQRPLNRNQLAQKLNLDYKTIEHHLSLMVKNKLLTIINQGSYGSVYVLSSEAKAASGSIDEILETFRKDLGETSEQVYKQKKKTKNKR